MKKRLINILFIAFILVMAGCENVNDPIVWEGKQIGFDGNSSQVFVDYTAATSSMVEIPVMLIGEQQGSPISYTVTVDAANTTAAEGVVYNIAQKSKSINASSSYSYIEVEVLPSGFTEGGQTETISLNVTSDQVEVAPNFANFTLNVTSFCAFNIDNFVGTYDVDEPGYGVYEVNAAAIDVDTLQIDNFWDSGWAVNYVFSGDLNQTVLIPAQSADFGDGLILTVTGSGTYDGCTGNFSVQYSVDGNDGVNYDTNTHTFTKTSTKTTTKFTGNRGLTFVGKVE